MFNSYFSQGHHPALPFLRGRGGKQILPIVLFTGAKFKCLWVSKNNITKLCKICSIVLNYLKRCDLPGYTISMKTFKTLYFVNASNPCNSQQMNGSTSLKSWPGHCCKVLLYNSLTFKKTFLACLFTIRNPTCTNHSILLQIVDQILLHV